MNRRRRLRTERERGPDREGEYSEQKEKAPNREGEGSEQTGRVS